MIEPITLTDEDRLILESYKNVIDGLSDYLGSGYEFVLHSLENFEHSVIKITNGFYTGRTIGSPITDMALYWLDQFENGSVARTEHISYFSKNKKGDPLKSSTIAIRGTGGRIIGLLCINFYLQTSMIEFCSEMVPSADKTFRQETFSDNPENIVRSELAGVRAAVNSDHSIAPSQKNKEIIRALNTKGIFQYKNAVEETAKTLNISINTVYFHLRNLAKE